MNVTGAPRLAAAHALDYCAQAATYLLREREAGYLLREREAGYPRAVEQGLITREASDHGIAMLRAIDAQWRWVMDGTRPPAPTWTAEAGDFGIPNHLLAAELATSAKRAREKVARKPGDFATSELADLVEALAWYQQDDCGAARIVMATIACRRLLAASARMAA